MSDHSSPRPGRAVPADGYLDDAAVALLEADARGGDAVAARTLGIAMRDRGLYEDAERWYRTAARTDGGCAFGLATLLEKSGDLDGAEQWYAAGAALGSLECKTNGAMLTARRGRPQDALPVLREAADEGDDVAADALEEHEDITALLQGVAEGIAAAEQDEDPKAALDTVESLTECTGSFGRFPDLLDEALALFDRAAGAGASSALIAEAFLLDDLGRWDEARRVLDEGTRRFPGESRLLYVLGLMLREHADFTGAEARLREAADAGDAEAQWSLAVLMLKRRRLDEAERRYRAYGEQAGGLVEPKDFEDGLRLVEKYRDEDPVPDRSDEAIAALRAAADAGDSAAAATLGDVLADCGAVNSVVLAALLPAAGHAHTKPEPDNSDVALIERVGSLCLRTDDEFGAGKWLRRAARLGHGKAAWWAGSESDEYGDPYEAERMWAVAAGNGHPFCGWLAGRAMVRRGAHGQAEPLLRIAFEAREREPALNEAAYWLGRSMLGQGRTDEAAQWLRTAVSVHGTVRLGYTGLRLASLFDPRVDLAEALLELGLDGEAGTLVEAVLGDAPGRRTALVLAERLAARRADGEPAGTP
ncbi:tetratricopeptide repeat protein [Actinomadura violacea]|uniref:Tetratricopeptide repeat protein n=1 Tax=Actinomadura violacea TaxID=2819934 RepID=A0ABS3RMZ3_9ACTN|nr:tetratricopeptide repeat protein [Actinomadura violacea]MBO2457450.1 tetratricopeptide repeat protein [Actinomadura violacea]